MGEFLKILQGSLQSQVVGENDFSQVRQMNTQGFLSFLFVFTMLE
jgi:hypothetical protein